MENNTVLTLNHVKVLFYHLNDPKFGSTITVDASDPEIAGKIESWATEQGLKMRIKDYTDKEGKTTKQATFKLASFLEVRDVEGNATDAPIKFGSTVSFKVSAYDYKNNFGAGRTASVTMIRINEVTTSKKESDFADLA